VKYKVVLHPLAKKDIEQAFKWYEKRSLGLGERFINAINADLLKLAIIRIVMQSEKTSSEK
jgi:hypothetical protein